MNGPQGAARFTTTAGRSRDRRGSFMLETIVALAVATALLGAAGVLVARMIGLQRHVETASRQTLILSRLSRQFRNDIHAAASVSVAEDGSSLELTPLTPEGRQVRYTPDNDSLVRTSTGEGADRFERYQFSAGTVFRFDSEPLAGAAMVSLEIHREPLPLPGSRPQPRLPNEDGTEMTLAAGPAQVLRIESVTGRDLRGEEDTP